MTADVSTDDTSPEDVDQTDTSEVMAETVPAFPGTGTERSQDADQQVSEDVPETFPRDYVEELRQENGRYRQRAARADELAQRLHTELVRATGRLADPTDLPFDETHLEVGDNLSTAIDELLARKPHLATRRPNGEIGQGATQSGSSVDLAAILRGNAG